MKATEDKHAQKLRELLVNGKRKLEASPGRLAEEE